MAKKQENVPRYGTTIGRGGGFPQKTSNGGRVLREVAAHAVGKGIFRHVERIYPDHEQLYCQTFRRYVS